jgi:site-specific recombinase XerD
VDLKTVQTVAGHSNPKITLQIYTVVTQEGFTKAKAVLNAVKCK